MVLYCIVNRVALQLTYCIVFYCLAMNTELSEALAVFPDKEQRVMSNSQDPDRSVDGAGNHDNCGLQIILRSIQ